MDSTCSQNAIFATAFIVVLDVSWLLAGCGGGGDHSPPPSPSNPVPTITSLSPNSVAAGSTTFTLMVTGTNFLSSSMVQWNGSARPTTFDSGTQVQAQINAADVAASGSVNVTVLNPSPGGGTSSAASFAISPVGISQTISVGANGAPPNGSSHQPALNLDGRFIAFGSEATNLISPDAMFAEGYVRRRRRLHTFNAASVRHHRWVERGEFLRWRVGIPGQGWTFRRLFVHGN